MTLLDHKERETTAKPLFLVWVKAMVPEEEVLMDSIQGMRRELYEIRKHMVHTLDYKFSHKKYQTQITLARKCRKLERIIDDMMLILIKAKR